MIIVILTLILILSTYLFGFLYTVVGSAIRRCTIAVFGWTGFCVLGLVGVPFHECSHLLTALLFNHTIAEFALYRPISGRRDGCLGYVNHIYDPDSLYQKAGNLIIGAAPMIMGALVLTFLFSFALPDTGSIVSDDFFGYVADIAHLFASELFSGNAFAVGLIIAAVIICPHIGMSKADFKNTFTGVFSMFSLAVIVPRLLEYYAGVPQLYMEQTFYAFAVVYVYSLFIGLLISAAMAALLWLFRELLCFFRNVVS